jgi:hypothetical protein
MLEDPGRVASLVIPFLSRQLPGSISATIRGIGPSVRAAADEFGRHLMPSLR